MKNIAYPTIEVGVPLEEIQRRDADQFTSGGYLAACTEAGRIAKNAKGEDWLHIPTDKYMAINRQFKKTQRPANQRGIRTEADAIKPEDATWEEFYALPLTGDRQKDAKQLWSFIMRIASGGCNCRVNFLFLMVVNPIRWEDFDVWRFEMHNLVNEHVGKKEMARHGKTTKRQWTVAEARERWPAKEQ